MEILLTLILMAVAAIITHAIDNHKAEKERIEAYETGVSVGYARCKAGLTPKTDYEDD